MSRSLEGYMASEAVLVAVLNSDSVYIECGNMRCDAARWLGFFEC